MKVHEQLYACGFGKFKVLFCNSFGNRSEWPCALQLLIKMLIRCCVKLGGAFTFVAQVLVSEVYCICSLKYFTL